jgi:excisionase family DNA binding protein
MIKDAVGYRCCSVQSEVILDKLLTADEVADYLRVDRNTIYIWCREGVLPAMKMGKEWRITLADLETFLSQRRRQQTSATSLEQAFTTRLGRSEHLLVLAADREAVWSLEVAFFSLAVEKGVPLFKGCWWQHPDDVRQRYSEAGLPVEDLEAAGRLAVHNFSQAYYRDGARAVIDLWQDQSSQGYFWGSGSYRTGDWEENLPELVDFEAGLHHALGRGTGVAICPCVPNLDTPDGLNALFDLTRHHTGTLLRLRDNQVSVLRPAAL